MKKILFVFILGVSSALSNAPFAQAEQFQSASCYAYTTCYNAWGQPYMTVSCQTWSGPLGACSWYVLPYRGVECQGYSAPWGMGGYWYRSYSNCY